MNALRLTRKITTLKNKANGYKSSLNTFAHKHGNYRFTKVLRYLPRR